jgi:hypothetical protein
MAPMLRTKIKPAKVPVNQAIPMATSANDFER